LPSAQQGFFWYNGAVYYTFFYALSLVLIGLLLLYFQTESKVRKKTYLCLSMFLAFLIGGGNYTTALLTVILLFLFCVGKALQKEKKWIAVLVILIVCIGGLFISVFAPGNLVRQAAIGCEPSALLAIGQSFYYALVAIRRWTTWPFIVLFLFLCPFLYRIVRGSGCLFRYPLLIFFASFCLFSAGFTPPLYALGISGLPDRLLNIQYFAYCLLVLLNLSYGLGWLSFRLKTYCSKCGRKEEAIWDKWKCTAQKQWTLLILVFFVAFAVCLYRFPALEKVTSVSAVESLSSGSAADYDAQARRRIQLLQSDEPAIALPAYTAKPYLLFFEDIEPDPSNWKNVVMAKYYKKDAIWLESALTADLQ
jgi:hypothetical protein